MPALLVVLAIANALLGMSLGLSVSAFATTEFQAVQFMPVFAVVAGVIRLALALGAATLRRRTP